MLPGSPELQHTDWLDGADGPAAGARFMIEQAKGLLAERWNAAVDDAFEMFRSYARARRLRLSDFATRIISGAFDTDAIPAPATARSEDRPS
ncbi:ANTAR domain-containing protein [Streptomyces sp. NBC_00443]|uniref:ANTAR domain-containing protein n=1 Tax=Streptomyces sp. NBC_00443 TaxID=2975743 RepID=UPI002E1DEF9A